MNILFYYGNWNKQALNETNDMVYVKLTKKELINHIKIWVLISSYLLFIDHGDASIGMQIFIQLLVTFHYMLPYYALSLYILPKFYKINNKNFILFSIIIYVLNEIINHLIFFNAVTMFADSPSSYVGVPFYEWLITSSIYFFIVSVVAFGSYQDRLSRMELQNQSEKEKALLIRELGFFKNQFNFHITFNFLNYCYGYMLKSSKEAAEAIELFSNMLRYVMLTKPDKPVPLKKEIEYIHQFIALHKRLDSKVYVQFNLDGDMNNKYILPCILTSFVENAFKHGVANDISNPILIYLDAFATSIQFKVVNKKSYTKKLPSTGVGQYNLKNQLELFYRDKHELSIDERDEHYFCKLVLTV
jgi:two-component system LytT family sensor kinase